MIINFLIKYWTQILFVISMLTMFIKMFIAYRESTKCSLRNDILQIYETCKSSKKISMYQKDAIHMSYDLYVKLKGNSFVKSIVEEIDTFEII